MDSVRPASTHFQLCTAADELRLELFDQTAFGSPGDAIDFVKAWTDGNVAEPVAVQFVASVDILMPNLQLPRRRHGSTE